jgi:hypothetical protein
MSEQKDVDRASVQSIVLLYYRVGFGVIGIAGFSNREPFATADECKAAIDEILNDPRATDVVAV